MSDMPERIWAWADQPPYDKHSGGWVYRDNGLDAVEYIRADLALPAAPLGALTSERAARAWMDANPLRLCTIRASGGINGWAIHPADDAVTFQDGNTGSVWSMHLGLQNYLAAALRAIVEARHE